MLKKLGKKLDPRTDSAPTPNTTAPTSSSNSNTHERNETSNIHRSKRWPAALRPKSRKVPPSPLHISWPLSPDNSEGGSPSSSPRSPPSYATSKDSPSSPQAAQTHESEPFQRSQTHIPQSLAPQLPPPVPTASQRPLQLGPDLPSPQSLPFYPTRPAPRRPPRPEMTIEPVTLAQMERFAQRNFSRRNIMAPTPTPTSSEAVLPQTALHERAAAHVSQATEQKALISTAAPDDECMAERKHLPLQTPRIRRAPPLERDTWKTSNPV